MGLFELIKSGWKNLIENKGTNASGLNNNWAKDRTVTLYKTPDDLEELKAAVDVKDPGSVAGYWLYSVLALTADYDAGMNMMKYLFAGIEPFGYGYTEGGIAGKAGWDSYFNERLTDDEYRWLPRAYFRGATAANGFKPAEPLSVELHYNAPNTEAVNSQSYKQLGRLNIVYWIQSNAAGNKVNITLSKFKGTDRWYVTSGTSCMAVFYDQRGGLTPEAKAKLYS